jgi:hypothetical protein
VNRDVYDPAAAQLDARQRSDSSPRVVFTMLLPTSMGKARPLLVFTPNHSTKVVVRKHHNSESSRKCNQKADEWKYDIGIMTSVMVRDSCVIWTALRLPRFQTKMRQQVGSPPHFHGKQLLFSRALGETIAGCCRPSL